LIDQIFQEFAGFEVQHLFGRNIDRFSRTGIPTRTPVSVSEAKAAEASKLDLFPSPERFFDGLEKNVDASLCFLFGDLHFLRDLVD
jgi:hypothetical protein